jgi:predicted DNA-binding transcriptional regulator AlpA
MSDLLDLNDIAARFKLRREYVRDRLSKRPDFPRPAVVVSQKNKLWSVESIAAWQDQQQALNAR